MSPDRDRQTDQPISGGGTLPEEAADLPCEARAADGDGEGGPATPVPMFLPRKAESALEGKYGVLST